MKHFLQRPPWIRLQESLGRTAVTDSGDGWSYQAFLETGKLNKRLYAPYGPVAESDAALREALASMKEKARELGAALLRVEPTGGVRIEQLPQFGLRRVKAKQPEHTQRIDIDRPFQEVLAEIGKSQRNLHRNYAKKGLSVRHSTDPDDVEHLIRLLGNVSDRTGMHAHDSDYLRANASALVPQGDANIYLTEYEGKVIAAAMVFDDEHCRYYAHAAADNEFRKLQPGPVLVSQMIEDATNGPQREFDLYGVVPPEQTDHPWAGFSKFKRTYGGYQVDFNGTWELPVKRLSYGLYTLARKVLKNKL